MSDYNLKSKRSLIKIIEELSKELKFEFLILRKGWLISISTKHNSTHIYGYHFELNTSTSQLIAKDKCACSELLLLRGIQSVEHHVFLKPETSINLYTKGSWKDIISIAEKFEYDMICKPCHGSSGIDVYHVTSELELELAAHKIFNKGDSLVISKFHHILNEYRVVVLHNEPLLYYKKVNSPTWKNNLQNGGNAVLDISEEIKIILTKIAIHAANAIDICFASIDIVETPDGFFVLEINSGVMLEYFSRQGKKEYELTKLIYKMALCRIFNFECDTRTKNQLYEKSDLSVIKSF